MDSVVEFFDAITDSRTWLRVTWVILGATLVYFALTSDALNRVTG